MGTIAIWGAVATVHGNLRINGDRNMVTNIMVGMMAFLSIGATVGTFAVRRSPRGIGPAKVVQREV